MRLHDTDIEKLYATTERLLKVYDLQKKLSTDEDRHVVAVDIVQHVVGMISLMILEPKEESDV